MASSASRVFGLILALVPLVVEAAAPETSLPPRLRPGGGAHVTAPAATGSAVASAVTPRLRGRVGDFRPRLRPGAGGPVIEAVSRTGALCGQRSLQGERLKPIRAGAGCGIAEPVRLRSVEGVALSEPAIVDCETALALGDWVREGAVPAWGRLGRGLASVSVSQSFTCRPEAPGAAAHTAGGAVDLTGFTLRNGVAVSVVEGWRDPVAGQVLRKARDGACERFETVFGPEAGRPYSDRLHLSTERTGRSKECR